MNIEDSVDIDKYILKYKNINNVKEFLEWIDIIFVFFKKRVEDDIKIVNRNKDIEINIKDVDLFKLWMAIDGDLDSEIYFPKVLEEKSSFFSKNEISVLGGILSEFEGNIIRFESELKIFEKHNGDLECEREEIISNYDDFLEFKKKVIKINEKNSA